jgi:hypothetical protein
LRAMGLLCDLGAGRGEAGKQASKKERRKQSNIKQITQIKAQITRIRIVWRFAQERRLTPPGVH